jgi:hypothetical protein
MLWVQKTRSLEMQMKSYRPGTFDFACGLVTKPTITTHILLRMGKQLYQLSLIADFLRIFIPMHSSRFCGSLGAKTDVIGNFDEKLRPGNF